MNLLRGIRQRLVGALELDAHDQFQCLIHAQIEEIRSDYRKRYDDALICYGRKIYSQCDEDGIISEIFNRIGRQTSVFVEIGVGDGRENNTHALLLSGWSGVWIDGDEDHIQHIKNELDYHENSTLVLMHAMVTRDNAANFLNSTLSKLQGASELPRPDFLSIDVDGNDLEILKNIISFKPRVICVEYNAKFPPPLKISVEYDADFIWSGDDFMGSSLQCFADMLGDNGYELVCCNISGANAFFVHKDDCCNKFTSMTVESLYQPARYHLTRLKAGHASSLKFLKNKLKKL